MKHSGKLSGNQFSVKSNGETKSYRVELKTEQRSSIDKNDSDTQNHTYSHTTKVAYDESGSRAGTIESGCTGNSNVLNTNNR